MKTQNNVISPNNVLINMLDSFVNDRDTIYHHRMSNISTVKVSLMLKSKDDW